jgi:hypothetical protein
MQIAPSELREMSLWELSAMIKGWNEAHKPDDKLTPQVEDELFAYIQEPPVWMN